MMKKCLPLLTIILSWLLLISAQKGISPYIDTLSLFWVGTGFFISVFFLDRLNGMKERPWKLRWKDLPMALCALIAYQLFFFQEELSLCFFVWAPLLFGPLLVIFFGKKKSNIRFTLIAAAIFILFLINQDCLISITATLLLVAFCLLTYKRKGSILGGALIQMIVAGSFSFLHWQGEESLSMIAVYASLSSGLFMGLAIQIFIDSFSAFSLKTAIIPISTCLLAELTFPLDGTIMIFFTIFTLFLSLIIMEKKGRYQEAPQARQSA